MLPRLLETSLDLHGFARSMLGAQRLGESEERPAVVRIVPQILTIDRLRSSAFPRRKELGPEQMAHREEPVGRLVVGQPVLLANRDSEGLERDIGVMFGELDSRSGNSRGETQDISGGIVPCARDSANMV